MNPGWFALAISGAALTVAILNWRDVHNRDRRDLYLKMHERLLETDQQEGRHILYHNVIDLESARSLSYVTGERAKVNKVLSTFDLLGYYIEAKLVSKDVVMAEWGHSIDFIAEHARLYIKATSRRYWTNRMPRLQRLLADAEAWSLADEPRDQEGSP